jgi:hypothetical protein
MVGAGGIGVVLYEVIRGFQYAQTCAVLIILVASVTLIDLLSAAAAHAVHLNPPWTPASAWHQPVELRFGDRLQPSNYRPANWATSRRWCWRFEGPAGAPGLAPCASQYALGARLLALGARFAPGPAVQHGAGA